ncbi:metallophosphoesterase family protein [Janthinobacterium sp. 1_2014MBL_MicDiv]|uniref:metallophosphoesterase family protein n=1 Tax=Janthinobacterium sp. 1_2014MBL_MicDiv TaxID=1644131 RepID=UPI0008F4AB5A|nr:metallophosphoesterase [Janthinobacterium sp. 1_2014MBL_MicDiv]APA70398.1 metallophosphoesterase [Janthinobacterium sp. 1_2014MBL_MicDiv]
MRLLILSDLHHELWRDEAPQPDLALSRPDVVILAGDIDTGSRAIAWATTTFAGLPVLYVHGNHEGYGHHLDKVRQELRAAAAATGNVHFLDCGTHVVEDQAGNKVRFLGATLWTDFRLLGDDTRQAAMRDAEAAMNDYRRIRLANMGFRKLRAADTAMFHAQQKAWLARELAQPFDGRTVVISHMAPSLLSVDDAYGSEAYSPAYASRLDALAAQADLWVHGHIHVSRDYRIGNCRVVCNPCGYKTRSGTPQNPRFDANFIVELAAR